MASSRPQEHKPPQHRQPSPYPPRPPTRPSQRRRQAGSGMDAALPRRAATPVASGGLGGGTSTASGSRRSVRSARTSSTILSAALSAIKPPLWSCNPGECFCRPGGAALSATTGPPPPIRSGRPRSPSRLWGPAWLFIESVRSRRTRGARFRRRRASGVLVRGRWRPCPGPTQAPPISRRPPRPVAGRFRRTPRPSWSWIAVPAPPGHDRRGGRPDSHGSPICLCPGGCRGCRCPCDGGSLVCSHLPGLGLPGRCDGADRRGQRAE